MLTLLSLLNNIKDPAGGFVIDVTFVGLQTITLPVMLLIGPISYISDCVDVLKPPLEVTTEYKQYLQLERIYLCR